MPHLDNHRREAWDRLVAATLRIQRQIDAELRKEWAIPYGWYEVLHALREANGVSRPLDLAESIGVPPSTLSRRLDRLAEEGWIERRVDVDASDLRAVDVELTVTGRKLWREMNVSYRRILQREFAQHLDDEEFDALWKLIVALDRSV